MADEAEDKRAGGLVPLSAFTSALVAALVGFGSTVAINVQAAQAMGGSLADISSSITALCLGIAIAGSGLSLFFRMPIVLAWSTPGAALIAASTLSPGWPVAIGAFVFAATLMVLLGFIPALGRLAARIPSSIAAAMLAGVLLPFCLNLFRTLQSDLLVAVTLLLVFVVVRQRLPIYAMLIVLVVAVGIVIGRGDASGLSSSSLFGMLEWTTPEFDPRAIISLGVPLFLVTLVSQNLPGLVVLSSAGYKPRPEPILLTTGLLWLVLAPFGAHSTNLAAITAAICTGEDAHPDKQRRWVVGIIYSGFYVLLALFSAPLIGLFMTMRPETIAAIAGIALLGPLTNAVVNMVAVPEDREAAVLTFAATASGVALFGIGSAFWGLVVGFIALGARALLAKRRSAV
ncbi:benzoate/H(+) symporter BenE family transporter [Flaviflagellibacter deserti]|uniref:Benzoate/H(+) symporter BenE family transporter n=1 Tax=Flaviflagellibacter deserti TaxID=2267266 RepID=A0ABV9YYM6_9HYPH